MIARLWSRIVTPLALALAVVALSIGGWAWGLKFRNDALSAAVSGYQEAVRIRRQSDFEQAKIRAEAAQIDTYLDTQEGGDAPLSDYLSDAAGKLWP
ncbi:hypothetical protein [Celeribacter ethanolicus]|uniref:hypothetical protein n=1 Tax=Celeribacter ethanolicus TaxID=1758178 RepID=UPI00083467D9|nr:hypothetical protein [Celeribacter ethanolicus]TNE65450.1 MAG: hypothetical protein EP336_12365 [Paracoccaceae bacterium]